jgi:nitric oxide synthase oxygenase domain/subunit
MKEVKLIVANTCPEAQAVATEKLLQKWSWQAPTLHAVQATEMLHRYTNQNVKLDMLDGGLASV